MYDGLLFQMTPERYEATSTANVKRAIVEAVASQPLRRPQVYEAIAPKYFLQYRSKDYRAMID